MHTLRVFFAILFPSKTHVELANYLHALQEVFSPDCIRWVQPEKMHITLQFLGNLPQAQLMQVTENVRTALTNQPAFQLELGHLEWFPTAHRPKVVSLGIQPEAPLAKLSATMGNVLISLNVPIETRPFRAHLTLGRLRRNKIPKELLKTMTVPVFSPINVTKIYLIESRPEKGEQNYYSLAEFKLLAGMVS
ncbi:RNA 2',3'-cyclic phosphodiesterase [Fluoribacter dumoffii]|uniref:RNA 2',3'-cyclic phosphodiesterase n=1 Tax=Fluoribacter dumoffii TaxID=463 RepID=UPI002244C547|nr:RNA 2',3'-cyclic phosphodiesterase [Fluoribacter dumoffii]MCW8387742.1 RNA 2',3'-cyclic phosphodiesterase [Fluoribacter dumoffii]MCW8497945.1 RNA 2',3'-cyclic phosphodiesterase [Fluoribacter dumoffii]